MNEDAWNSLPTDLQDIIMNDIVPEIQAWCKIEMPKEETKNLEIIEKAILAKGGTMNRAGPDTEPEIYVGVLDTDTAAFMFEVIDSEVVNIVDELRPSKQ